MSRGEGRGQRQLDPLAEKPLGRGNIKLHLTGEKPPPFQMDPHTGRGFVKAAAASRPGRNGRRAEERGNWGEGSPALVTWTPTLSQFLQRTRGPEQWAVPRTASAPTSTSRGSLPAPAASHGTGKAGAQAAGEEQKARSFIVHSTECNAALQEIHSPARVKIISNQSSD